MKRKAKRFFVPRPDYRKWIAYLRGKYDYILMAAFLLIGMVVGALLAQNPDHVTQNGISSIITGYSVERSSQSFGATFLSSMQSVLPFFLIVLLSGVFALGALLVPLTLLFRGLGIGLAAGYLYSVYGFQGFFYSLLMVLPQAFMSAVLLIVLARDAIHLSAKLAALFFSVRKGRTALAGFPFLLCPRRSVIFNAVRVFVAGWFVDSYLRRYVFALKNEGKEV